MPKLRLARGAVVVVIALLLLPTVAAAIDCPTRSLPRPAEDHATIRARLEAEGKWHRNGNPALSPPADPQVGDTWLWYVWDLRGYPVANLKPATVRGMGDHCYVVVDDEQWNVTMDQADVDRVVSHFDAVSVGQFPNEGIWDLDTSHFGAPPNNLDGLDRIFLFYYRFNIASDGFFWIYDQYPNGSQPFASNECDVIYMATDSGEPASDYMLAVTAHEFQHMIHFNQDEDEVLWVDEGMGELAMWLFGHPDTISGFNSQPDNSLLAWNSQWADYIKTYLWTLYVYEQYGGQPVIWDVVHNPANSLAGYQAALQSQGYPQTTSDVFRDWAVANYLDDTTVPDGQYGYAGDDLPNFNAFRTHTTFPASGTGNVQAHAADYLRLQNLTGAPVVHFNGLDTRPFRLMLLARDATLPTLVRSFPLDAAQDGTYEFTDAAGYDEVVLAIANVSPTSTATYSYSVEEISLTPVGDVVAASGTGFGAAPNPFNPRTEFTFTLARQSDVRLTVLDARGREVATLAAQEMPAGGHAIPWDATDAAAGVYVGRLVVDGRAAGACKVTIVK
jgi:hypothetical protein